jgi:hypothetical protein
VGRPIADCRFRIVDLRSANLLDASSGIDQNQSEIFNQQSAIVEPTRYREVVLTSWTAAWASGEPSRAAVN